MNTILNSDQLRYIRNVAKLTVFRGWNNEDDLVEFYKNLKLAPKLQVYKIPLNRLPNFNTLTVICHVNPSDFVADQISSYLYDERILGKLQIIIYSDFNGTTKYQKIRKSDPSKKGGDFAWIQCIDHRLLKVFIPDHYMIPKHELVKESEMFNFKEFRYNSLHVDYLPTINVDDPMVVYLGGRVNDIIKITTHDNIMFRKVVEVDLST